MQTMRMSLRAGRAAADRAPRPRCRRSPASDRSSAHSCCARLRRQLRVVARGDGRHLVALQADVADARGGHELQHRVEHAEARAQHRHDDDVAAMRRPWRRPSGVSAPSRLRVGSLAQRFGREQHADARAPPAKMFGRRVACRAASTSASCTSGWSTRWTGTAPSLYNFCPMRAHRGALAASLWRRARSLC